MTTDLWHKTGKYFNYRGRRIFYQESGTGPVLLLLHGFPTSSWDWHKVWADLSQGYSLLAPDFIGFGFSEKPKAYRYSIQDQADLVELLLESKQIDSVDILAHDYGDTVAQELLARYQWRQRDGVEGLQLRSVCLSNGGIFPEAHHPRRIQRLLASPLGFLLSPFLSKARLRSNFQAIFSQRSQPAREDIDRFWRLITYNNGKRIAHRLIRYMHERRQFRDRWVGALQQAQIPLALIDGTDDPISGRHLAEHFQDLVPQGKVFFLEGIGHYPQFEDPAAFLSAYFSYREWVESRG